MHQRASTARPVAFEESETLFDFACFPLAVLRRGIISGENSHLLLPLLRLLLLPAVSIQPRRVYNVCSVCDSPPSSMTRGTRVQVIDCFARNVVSASTARLLRDKNPELVSSGGRFSQMPPREIISTQWKPVAANNSKVKKSLVKHNPCTAVVSRSQPTPSPPRETGELHRWLQRAGAPLAGRLRRLFSPARRECRLLCTLG